MELVKFVRLRGRRKVMKIFEEICRKEGRDGFMYYGQEGGNMKGFCDKRVRIYYIYVYVVKNIYS